MNTPITTAEDLKNYYQNLFRAARLRAIGWEMGVMILFGLLAYFSHQTILYLAGFLVVGIIAIIHRRYHNKSYKRLAVFKTQFPVAWCQMLEKHSVFFKNLDAQKQTLFEKRVQLFMLGKRVEGIDTEIDDEIRVLVAASAIIPTFAFPAFDYPDLNEVLVYPASFSEKFEIGAHKNDENIEGMVGNRYMNHSLLLSKPALLSGFNGKKGENNVGIHEFVHLLDREDGETDGVPERLADHAYALPWLHLIKKEMQNIRSGESDINPYAITNNAEFLAVVSEYFFNNPEEFQQKHPELYEILTKFYHIEPAL
ncbi:zinc-dependent peptidase [Dyadobacter sp. CY356]|uniref:M90 family metallopeptidase n=1 Tax=Dyadobacter sp. CY356 TaxID=2906442 RepID=UPI001F323AB9|nr:M90 family metallopeptidase [Dyadobacter sp. CY356]MCF0056426.1 zinc-dependent peptidase [Dyadobacter sp. CY356]